MSVAFFTMRRTAVCTYTATCLQGVQFRMATSSGGVMLKLPTTSDTFMHTGSTACTGSRPCTAVAIYGQGMVSG